MRPPEGVANTLAASEIQDVEAQMPEPVVGLKQGSIGVGSRVELVRGGGGGRERRLKHVVQEKPAVYIIKSCSHPTQTKSH